MSEKRFKQFGLWIIDDPNSNVNSIADLIDTKLMFTNEVVDLLNELFDENEQLKKENEHLRQSIEYWQKKYEEGTETFQINENDIGGGC